MIQKLHKLSEFSKKNIKSLFFILILTLLTGWITYYRIHIQIDIGPIWDTFDFLADAAYFAGQGFGYTDLTRPPILPFLTSIFFKLGYTSETVIFYVDGALFIFGVIGLYLLLKQRFNDIKSFLGSLIYSSMFTVVLYVGVGLTDIASVSFSIWTIYLTVLAVKKDSKFFYLSFPLLTLTFLTRYVSGFTLFPVFLYILISCDIRKNSKNLLIGILISFLILVPVLIFFYKVFGNPFFAFNSFFNASSQGSAFINRSEYNPDIFYYITNFASLAGIFVTTITLVIIFGIISYIALNFRKLNIKKTYSKIKGKNIKFSLITVLALVFIFLGTFSKLPYLVGEIIFFLICYITYNTFKNSKLQYLDINLLFLSWFMAYFIFHSIYVIKDNRYFVTMAPAISFFLILGLSEIFSKLRFKIKNKNMPYYAISIALILIILNPTILLGDIGIKDKAQREDINSVANWLKNYDPSYENKTIYADYYWPYFSWYLKTDIKKIPNQNGSTDFDKELKIRNADYFINAVFNVNLKSYVKIAEFKTKYNDIIIYKKQE